MILTRKLRLQSIDNTLYSVYTEQLQIIIDCSVRKVKSWSLITFSPEAQVLLHKDCVGLLKWSRQGNTLLRFLRQLFRGEKGGSHVEGK